MRLKVWSVLVTFYAIVTTLWFVFNMMTCGHRLYEVTDDEVRAVIESELGLQIMKFRTGATLQSVTWDRTVLITQDRNDGAESPPGTSISIRSTDPERDALELQHNLNKLKGVRAFIHYGLDGPGSETDFVGVSSNKMPGWMVVYTKPVGELPDPELIKLFGFSMN